MQETETSRRAALHGTFIVGMCIVAWYQWLLSGLCCCGMSIENVTGNFEWRS